MVRFLFPSLFKKVTKEKETEVEAETLGEALDRLVEKYGDSFRDMVFDKSGELNRYLRFFIKGRSISELNDLYAQVGEKDEIAILIIIGGG